MSQSLFATVGRGLDGNEVDQTGMAEMSKLEAPGS